MKISLVDKEEKKSLQIHVISKIRDLIKDKSLKIGDKLPSERVMSERLGVKRNHIREAIRRLEFYGILKSRAKSGTKLAIGLTGLNGMVDEIVSLEVPSFAELVETRISLEQKIVVLAAERRSDEDLKRIKDALAVYKSKISKGEDSLEADLLFHLAIAKASKNSTLINLMLLITPPILAMYERDMVCKGDIASSEVNKHENIYFAIESKDSREAQEMMEKHFIKLNEFIANNK